MEHHWGCEQKLQKATVLSQKMDRKSEQMMESLNR